MDSGYKGLVLTLALALPIAAWCSSNPPCGGPTDLLSIIDRPTIADSVCLVPNKSIVMESGYQHLSLLGGGTQQNFPEALLRFGLADEFEFNILLPNYIHQNILPYTGYQATVMGVKHQIGSSSEWVTVIDGYVILPSGTANFGSERIGGIVNGLFGYNFTSEINLSGMLGVSSQTQSINEGGMRFTSVNPALVLSWSKEKVSVYWEIYGQSKPSPEDNAGLNTDAGVIYLIKKNIAIDLEAGQRINGSLGGFSHFWGAGISIQFS
ncbi:hypothetical protein TUM19329_19630 [Legionella antarctica]|uniref:Transporter n=1 Tax=Legionella antarctica TaxID=2708020 RepID=A0A6F8T6E3_9GAMM|nr:transporter [Legionella antarctica]BCA95602.1 hypothetical protein TUM19329_19630 [Legionella antarctica]